MKLYESKVVAIAQAGLAAQGKSDGLHYCYHCDDCGRLITKLEIINRRSRGEVATCPCGSRKIRPGNATNLQEILLPRCWKLIYLILKNQISHAPVTLTAEEQMSADRTARVSIRAYERQMEDMSK